VKLTGAVDELVPTGGLAQFPADYQRFCQEQTAGRLPWLSIRPEATPRRMVNLHDDGPRSIRCLQQLGPSKIISYAHPECPEVSGPDWRPGQHDVDRWCSLLESRGIPTDRADLQLQQPMPSPCPGVIVLHPGASYRSRRWPPGRFAEVARKLDTEGHRIVITGTPQERKLCCWTAERAGLPESVVLAGRTDLGLLAGIVAEAELVISGDTGAGHLATALDTPSVLLFGPTPPTSRGPIADPQHIALWAGRTGDPLGPFHDRGLMALQVDEVLNSVHRLVTAA
jgi:ADP-heptose:LPS heptosyltransferase